jgi:heterotetrameric sarcosine oxidase gamma subunit
MATNSMHSDSSGKRPTALQQAGIDERDLHLGEVRLREMPVTALARLRFFAAPSAADCPLAHLPLQVGQCGGADPVFLCLGPSEWLAISQHGTPETLMEALRPATDGGQAVACDLSDGLSLFRLSGSAAPWLLAKLSCLDFVHGRHGGEHCARTRMIDIAVTVHYYHAVDDGWGFDLIADRSIASYLWGLLRASASHANQLEEAYGAPA